MPHLLVVGPNAPTQAPTEQVYSSGQAASSTGTGSTRPLVLHAQIVDWFRLFTFNELLTEPSVYLDAGKKVFSKHLTQKRGDAEIEAGRFPDFS